MEDENSEEDNEVILTNKNYLVTKKKGEKSMTNLPNLPDSGGSRNEKRKTLDQSEESISENDFITVTRRKTKVRIRSNSFDIPTTEINMQNEEVDEEKYVICITSSQSLPKQMAMAKLLRSHNHRNITKIKYKSPLKVLVQFETLEDAEKLNNCPKFQELGYRCEKTSKKNICFGIVRGVDLELKEKEIMEILESSIKILDVKRLKRTNSEGKWVESETIRIRFMSTSLPEYIYAYEVRFKVEPYSFPVTQCSACWKFGHFIKYCPTKKSICPKCGGDHDNCLTTNFKCINCKGSHMALDKECPIYIKERAIRDLMTSRNMSYREALVLYLKERPKRKILVNTQETVSANRDKDDTYTTTQEPTKMVNYERTMAEVHAEDEDSISNYSEPSIILSNTNTKTKNKKKKNRKGKSISHEPMDVVNENNGQGRDTRCISGNKKGFDFKTFISRTERIILSSNNFETKCMEFIKLCIQEVKSLLFKYITTGELVSSLLAYFDG